MTGLIQAETAGSLTLARDKGVTETIQKQNIEQIKSTGTSLMPEGLEKTIDPQSMADLLAFLEAVQYDIGTLPDFVAPAEVRYSSCNVCCGRWRSWSQAAPC